MNHAALALELQSRRGHLRLEVALQLAPGWTVLFGPSGSGKSTLLRMVAGLDTPDQGRISIGDVVVTDIAAGQYVPPHLRRVRMVAQRPALFSGRTVEDNVRYGARDTKRLAEAVELCDVGPLLPRFVHQLSGGERQRVALARTLAADAPAALLLDEPFTGLDLPARDALLRSLQQWPCIQGIPVLFVTHEVGEALACAGRCLRLVDGKVIADGSTADVLQAESALLQRRLEGSMQRP